jgi:hypothetical protein
MIFNEQKVREAILSMTSTRVMGILKGANYMVAGGSLLDLAKGRTPKDLDMFIDNTEKIGAAISELHRIKTEMRTRNSWHMFHIYTTPNSTSLSYVHGHVPVIIQFINEKHTGENHLDTLNRFDLKICRVGYSYKEDKFIYGDGWQESFDSNTIGIDPYASNTTFSTFTRVMKYKEKGFDIDPLNLVEYYMSLTKIKTLEEFKEHFVQISEGFSDKAQKLLAETEEKLAEKYNRKEKLKNAARRAQILDPNEPVSKKIYNALI